MLQDNRRHTAPDVSDEDDTIDLLAVAGALWRGKLTLLFAALLAGIIGVYYAFMVAVPTYEASTSLALELETSPLSADIGQLFAGASTESEALNTELEVIKSRGILRQLVDRLELTSDPEFNAALRPEPVFSIGDLVAGLVVLVLGPTEPDPNPEIREFNRTLAAVREAISARIQPNTYVFNIAVTTEVCGKVSVDGQHAG